MSRSRSQRASVMDKTLTLEMLTKTELIALVRRFCAQEVDLWHARCEVHYDEVKALTKAHEAASQKVAPFRVALWAADTASHAWNKAHRALRAAEAEERELWCRLERAWAQRDAGHDRLNQAYERAQQELEKAEVTDG